MKVRKIYMAMLNIFFFVAIILTALYVRYHADQQLSLYFENKIYYSKVTEKVISIMVNNTDELEAKSLVTALNDRIIEDVVISKLSDMISYLLYTYVVTGLLLLILFNKCKKNNSETTS